MLLNNKLGMMFHEDLTFFFFFFLRCRKMFVTAALRMNELLIYHMLALVVVTSTVKPALSDHSKIDKKCLKDNGSLMKVESSAECSLGAFCNTFDLH